MFQLKPGIGLVLSAVTHVYEAVLVLDQVQVKQYGFCDIQKQRLFLCHFGQVYIKISQYWQALHLGVNIVLLEYDFAVQLLLAR